MANTYDFNQAEKQITNLRRNEERNFYNVEAKCAGNPVVGKINSLTKLHKEALTKNTPHCKNKFLNSVGVVASSQSTRRCEFPMIYRFMMDVFQVENVKLIRINDFGYVELLFKFLLANLDRCWWPTAFFDKKIGEDKEMLKAEWKHNLEVNPYFKLVAEGRALVGR